MAGDERQRRERRALRIPLLALAAVAMALAAPVSASAAEPTTPASHRMTLAFPGRAAEVAGPGALVEVRCVGTLSLSVAGNVHKVPYSVSKGRRQYLVVPLGADLPLIDSLHGARATAIASTIQADGAAVTARRTLRLK